MSETPSTESCILAPDGVYSLRKYENEKELERLVVENAAHLFGTRSIYFDIKQRVESKAKMRITDGLLLDLNESTSPRFWIVEVELSRHDLYKDVEPQVRGFLRALNLEDTLSVVRNTLYEELRKDRNKMKLVRETSAEEDVHYFIERVLHTKPGVIVVIDSQTPQLEEIAEDVRDTSEVRVIEFKTYSRGKRLLHTFTPLAAAKEEREPLLEQRINWNARLQWINPETRTLAEALIKQIENKFPTAKHRPKYRWYFFYSTQEMKPESRFAVLTVDEKTVKVRICVDPESFQDPEMRAKSYKGWFYKESGHVEKGFALGSADDIPYALNLVRQSYERKQS